jgi:single-strand DNA-binding protein
MSGLPRITGTFGVVADPGVRFSQSGNCILNLRLIAKKRVRDSNGNWSDGPTPLFIDCTAFGKQAEHLADSIAKGDTVILEGTLEQQEWDDKETGEKRSKVCIIADEIGVSTQWGPAKSARVLEESGPSKAAADSDEPPF